MISQTQLYLMVGIPVLATVISGIHRAILLRSLSLRLARFEQNINAWSDRLEAGRGRAAGKTT